MSENNGKSSDEREFSSDYTRSTNKEVGEGLKHLCMAYVTPPESIMSTLDESLKQKYFTEDRLTNKPIVDEDIVEMNKLNNTSKQSLSFGTIGVVGCGKNVTTRMLEKLYSFNLQEEQDKISDALHKSLEEQLEKSIFNGCGLINLTLNEYGNDVLLSKLLRECKEQKQIDYDHPTKEDLQKRIIAQKKLIKYAKNPMERINLQKELGKLEKELKEMK